MTKQNLENTVKLEFLNGKDYPPDVVILENGTEKIRWSFRFDNHDNSFYAEGTGPKGFYKTGYLGCKKEEAIRVYNRLFVQPDKESTDSPSD